MSVIIKPIPEQVPHREWWKGEVVWVSGATGSWGQEICRQLLTLNIKKLLCFCRGEHRAYYLNQKLNDPRVRIHLGDIRDRDRVAESTYDATVVIHAAALKRIDSVSFSPNEIADVNIAGAQNLIRAIRNNDILRAFYVSSDKAYMPTNFYGLTKATAESLWLAANQYSPAPQQPWLSAARFGNAIGSNGSVLRIWDEQIRRGDEFLTVTDPYMTRFLITLPQAVRFLLSCFPEMKGGELWAPGMISCTIGTLAKAFAPEMSIKIVGSRGMGEKDHESISETWRSSQSPERDPLVIRNLLKEGGISCH